MKQVEYIKIGNNIYRKMHSKMWRNIHTGEDPSPNTQRKLNLILREKK